MAVKAILNVVESFQLIVPDCFRPESGNLRLECMEPDPFLVSVYFTSSF